MFFAACSKSVSTAGPVDPPVTPPPAPPLVSYNYKSDNAYNLNVVYFVPNDVVEPADYHRRLSEILLQAQSFFGTEMQRNGYGIKSFGLLKDEIKKRVQLIVIKGKQGRSAYPYEGGANAVMNEVNAYRAANASMFSSDHYLVILPATQYDANGEPGGVPFYGLGKFCFALDYADQDIKYLGTGGVLGTRAVKWIGGMIHELGHGLNLPHNCQKVSEGASLGMALMWAGNSTWGVSKTFLTGADCAVLNVNQIFSKEVKAFYGEKNASIKRIHASYDDVKQSIIVKGIFASNETVTDILYYNDPNVNNEGIGVNRDYNAVAWTSKPIGADSFYVEMPVVELHYKSNEVYELKVKLALSNGLVRETIYPYSFVNGVPQLEFSTRSEFNKQGWSIASFSSEETASENGAVTNLIDGDISSYWHSRWSVNAAVYPHEIIIKTGENIGAAGFSIVERPGLARAVKDLELLISLDGISYQSAGVSRLANSSGLQYFSFATLQTVKYIKLIARSSWDGEKFASLGEFGLF